MRRKQDDPYLRQLHELAEQYPRGSEERAMLLEEVHHIFMRKKVLRRRGGRPRRLRDKQIMDVVALALYYEENFAWAARLADRSLNPKKDGGRKHRVEYLAKKARKAIAALSPAERDYLAREDED